MNNITFSPELFEENGKFNKQKAEQEIQKITSETPDKFIQDIIVYANKNTIIKVFNILKNYIEKDRFNRLLIEPYEKSNSLLDYLIENNMLLYGFISLASVISNEDMRKILQYACNKNIAAIIKHIKKILNKEEFINFLNKNLNIIDDFFSKNIVNVYVAYTLLFFDEKTLINQEIFNKYKQKFLISICNIINNDDNYLNLLIKFLGNENFIELLGENYNSQEYTVLQRIYNETNGWLLIQKYLLPKFKENENFIKLIKDKNFIENICKKEDWNVFKQLLNQKLINISDISESYLINFLNHICETDEINYFNNIKADIEEEKLKDILNQNVYLFLETLCKQDNWNLFINIIPYLNNNLDINKLFEMVCENNAVNIIYELKERYTLKNTDELLKKYLVNNQYNYIKELLKFKNVDTSIIQDTQLKDILLFCYDNKDFQFLDLLIDKVDNDKIDDIIKNLNINEKYKILSIINKSFNLNFINKDITNITNDDILNIINTPDERGLTLFMYTCQYCNQGIIKTLINFGANLSLKDKRGFSVLDNFKIYNYRNKYYNKTRLLLGDKKPNDVNIDLNNKLYFSVVTQNKKTFEIFLKKNSLYLEQLAFDINYTKNLVQEYIQNKEKRQLKKEKSLIERTVFCANGEIEKTIQKLQEEIGDTDEIRYIRVNTGSHNYSIAVSKNTVLGMDSMASTIDKMNFKNNTKVFAIGNNMQKDGMSCGIFSLEIVLTLDEYIKKTGITLEQFVEETKQIGKFKDEKPDRDSTDFCETIPIHQIFAHIIQRSYETIEQNIFISENLEKNKTNAITTTDQPRKEITQKEILDNNEIELEDGIIANNYISKVREIAIYDIVNKTQEIEKEDFDKIIEEYRSKKARLNKNKRRMKNKLFKVFSKGHDILIEADRTGDIKKIYITESEEYERENLSIQKVQKNKIICEKEGENLVFKMVEKYKEKKELLDILNILNNVKLKYDCKQMEQFINEKGISKFISEYAKNVILSEEQKKCLQEFENNVENKVKY